MTAPDRARHPLLRKGNEFVKVSWKEAMDLMVDRFAAAYKNDPQSVAFYGSGQAYTEESSDPRVAINDLINEEWVWRLPHVVNHAHLRPAAGDDRGRDDLRALMARADEVRAEGVVNVDPLYWVASAHAVLGENERALELLEGAAQLGWNHAWWARHDWNWTNLADDSRFRDLLVRGRRAALEGAP